MGDDGRNILITGAAGGLGSALAADCAARGAQLLLVDKNLRGLEGVCDRVEEAGAPAPTYCQLDLAQAGPDALAELVSGFTEGYGDLHGLAHCAARFDGLSPLDQVSGEAWLSQLQVNLNAAWLLTVTCLPSLKRSGEGRVVFILDDEVRSRSAYWGAYGVSKSAVRAMAQIFGEELEGMDCRVFGVEPGPMRTDLRATVYMAENPEDQPSPERAAAHVASLLMGELRDQPVIHAVPES